MRRIISRKFSAAAKVNSDREILGVTKNASLKGMALIRVQRQIIRLSRLNFRKIPYFRNSKFIL